MSGIDIPEEMKAKYIERRKQDYVACLDALNKNDFETFLRIGHQLKGNAASFGYDDLGLIAAELENAARAQNLSQIKSLLSKFENFLKNK
ncbi:MAG: Hpt domain-containing protein [Bdellovibrionaceae bacterium]|nr:Hpt domain-containing protein [Pseudobdellovibrionaceae bacterium]